MKEPKIPLNKVQEWMKDKEYVRASDIQRELSVGYITSQNTLNWLIDLGLLESSETADLGHKVTGNKPLFVRVVKGDWRSEKTLFLSEPVTIKEAMLMIKEIVPQLPARGEGSELVKFVEDQGKDFDYMKNCGGWLIYTSRQQVPW